MDQVSLGITVHFCLESPDGTIIPANMEQDLKGVYFVYHELRDEKKTIEDIPWYVYYNSMIFWEHFTFLKVTGFTL